MGVGNALRENGTGGEVSPRILYRPTVTKVANGYRTLENSVCVVHGGVYKRPGTKHVIELPATTRVRLEPFQYSTEQSYMLMFGNEFVWFFKNGGIITHATKTITGITAANPAVVTSAAHGYSNGDKVYITSVAGMTEVNNRWFTVANVTTDTFELSGVNSSGYTAYSSGGAAGEIVELTTTYTTAQIARIQTQQINDVMYIVHPDHPIRKLERSSDTSWALTEPVIDTGPFRTVNTDDITLTPSSPSTSATAFGTYTVDTTFTLTASASYFDEDMVGAYFRLYENGGGTGIGGAPIGESTKSISNGDSYTYQGNVYGVSNVTTATTWEPFTRVPEHDSGSVKVSVGSNSFVSNFLHPGYCIIQITAWSSATVVTARVIRYQMPNSIATSGTSYWQEGSWSDYRGFPSAITLYEQRLFFAGSVYDPTVIWGSRSGAYEDFEDGDEDDDAIIYRLSSGLADVIRWMSGRRILTCGTSQGEYAVAASSQQEALTPSNVRASLQSDIGTSDCLPCYINQAVLYPQRNGDPDNAAIKLREFAYLFSDDKFNSVDITIFAEHIFGGGIERIAYAREPESLIWCLRTDGTLACCTYERDQEVVGWHRHTIQNGIVKEIATKPGDNGDELWMQVNRTIDETTVSYIEVMQPRFRELQDDKEDAWFLDCALQYSGSSTSTITGLWHLRGEDVTILNNGNVETQTVSDTGALTLDVATTKATIGYAYRATMEPTEIEAAAQQGTARSRPKNVGSIWVRVLDSLGGTVGTVASEQKPLLYRTTQDPMDSSPPLYTGNIEVRLPNGWEREMRVQLQHDDPLPFFVTAIVYDNLSVSG